MVVCDWNEAALVSASLRDRHCMIYAAQFSKDCSRRLPAILENTSSMCKPQDESSSMIAAGGSGDHDVKAGC